MTVLNDIKKIVGEDFFYDGKAFTSTYRRGNDGVLVGKVNAVVSPRDAEEIAEILRIANKNKIGITPRGGGTDLCGGAKPIGEKMGGIVLDLNRLNKIIDIDEENMIVTVETGVVWSKLNETLNKMGYFTGCLGPASGISATIGGGISNNSIGGGGAAMYGNSTEQTVGLEVVLPTGKIINTGAKANKFCMKPFTRTVLGPDYTGLFLGDAGINGIKTKISLRIYPLPSHRAYGTFEIKDKEAVKLASNIMFKWQHQQLPLFDFFYFPKTLVKFLSLYKVYKSFAKEKVRNPVLFYTTVAHSQKELENNVERIEKVTQKENVRKLGEKAGEGNVAQWFYEEKGNYKYAYAMFGSLPETVTLGGCLKTYTYELPKYEDFYENWSNRNKDEIEKVGIGGASFAVFGIYPCYIDVGGAIVINNDPTKKEGQYNLWENLLKSLIEIGACHYWMGEIISQTLISSAFSEDYYNFMKSIKKVLDPNGILSPGKFHLGIID